MLVYLGLDFGTSGARVVAIDEANQPIAQASYRYDSAASTSWSTWKTLLFQLIYQIPAPIRRAIQRIAINGTSSTVLLCDRTGQPLADPLLYNDDRGQSELPRLRDYLPADAACRDTVLSATSSLVKLLWWQRQPYYADACYLMHQADWLAFLLHGQPGLSDYHNALKLGYDVVQLAYPDWLLNWDVAPLLSRVLAPGTPVGAVVPAIAGDLGLSPNCQVCVGTTDSIAAFLASGVTQPGEAVTSLGSTLVLKLLSTTRVEAGTYGIYSHRLGDRWLVGGASNTGGAVLQQFFTTDELEQLSQTIDPEKDSGLDYYPLLRPGDRFPISDPHLLPRLEPRPSDPAAFLHGLLEGMARIEAHGYKLLQRLGASPLSQVYTAGGGAHNAVWTEIRARCLGIPVQASAQIDAAHGTALLAKQASVLNTFG